MKKLLNAYRTFMLETKPWTRIATSIATGFALFCVVFATVHAVDRLIDGHRPFFVVASIVAVNVFLYYPAITKTLNKKPVEKTVSQPDNHPSKPVPVETVIAEQTLADVGEEFAQEVTNVPDEDLEEESEEFP